MGKGKNPTINQHGHSPSGSHQHWGISIKKRNHVLGYNTQAAKKKEKRYHTFIIASGSKEMQPPHWLEPLFFC